MKETDKIWHMTLQFLLKNISVLKYYIISMASLVQDWSISTANVLQILKFCFKQLIYS